MDKRKETKNPSEKYFFSEKELEKIMQGYATHILLSTWRDEQHMNPIEWIKSDRDFNHVQQT